MVLQMTDTAVRLPNPQGSPSLTEFDAAPSVPRSNEPGAGSREPEAGSRESVSEGLKDGGSNTDTRSGSRLTDCGLSARYDGCFVNPAESTFHPAVWTRALSRDFGKNRAVDRLDLAIQPGEFYGLLGPNGAGKTTSIKMIVGLLRPTEGTAGIGEHETWKSPIEVKRRIGVLPEEFNLYERLTGAELLDFTAALHGLTRVSWRG